MSTFLKIVRVILGSIFALSALSAFTNLFYRIDYHLGIVLVQGMIAYFLLRFLWAKKQDAAGPPAS